MSVWKEAAQLALEEHGILPTTFPLGSFDISMLKHIATSPARFSRLLRNPSSQGDIPARIVRPIPGLNDLIEGLGMIECGLIDHPYLLAGGRYVAFVIAATMGPWAAQRDQTYIQLWDLGYPGTDTQFKPIIQEMLEEPYWTWLIAISNDGSYHLMAQRDKQVLDPNNLDCVELMNLRLA